MNEYEAKIKDSAEYIRNLRGQSGATANTLMFSLLATLLAKNKLSEKDIDVIFKVEIDSTVNTLKSYFTANYGDPTFDLKNEKELEDVQKIAVGGIEEIRKYVKDVAAKIKTPRQKNKDAALKAKGIDPADVEEEEEDE
jgi:hypothetical protein